MYKINSLVQGFNASDCQWRLSNAVMVGGVEDSHTWWAGLLMWWAELLIMLMCCPKSPIFLFGRFDIYSLDKSAKQDEEGIKRAAGKGRGEGFHVHTSTLGNRLPPLYC